MLLLDKPVGVSSNAALQRARRLFEAREGGTHRERSIRSRRGLLPICFGEATKFSQALLDAPQALSRHRALRHRDEHRRRGRRDRRARPRRRSTRDTIAAALRALRRRDRAGAAAARGAEARRPARTTSTRAPASRSRATPREVVIDALDARRLVAARRHRRRGLLERHVRSRARRGHRARACKLRASRRAASHGNRRFRRRRMRSTLEALEALDMPERVARLLPVDAALAGMPALAIGPDDALALAQGRRPRNAAASGRYRGYGPGGFVGLLEATGTELRADPVAQRRAGRRGRRNALIGKRCAPCAGSGGG